LSVNAIREALDQAPRVAGMIGAALVDAATGQVVGTFRPDDGHPGAAGPPGGPAPGPAVDGDTAIVAAATTDIVHVLALMAADLAAADDLEELIITSRGRYHLIRPLTAPGHEGSFLLVTLDRERANLALARHQLLAFESQIVA
jgi:hypothetical protein